MNFIDYALRDIPSNLYKNVGTAYTDIALPSGTSTGTVSKFSAPIVAGSSKSAVVGSAGTLSYGFSDKNFVTGNEFRPFTLAIAALSSSVVQEVGLLSHLGSSPLDGIVISKDYVIFRVIYGAGTVEAKWEYDDFPDAFLIHAVYMPTSIKLFVNGELVVTTDVPSGYPESGFNTSSGDGTLYAGKGTGASDKVIIDVPASYPWALREEQIQRQYGAMVDVVPMSVNVGSYGGVLRDGTDRRISQQKVFNSSDSWAGVSFTDVSYTSGELIPLAAQDTGASKAGVWIGQYPIDNPDVTSMSGIKIEWNGNGSYTVQTSLDGGTTWASVSNGELVPTSQGLNPSGKILLVKITFTGGVVNDISEVKNMTITTYADNYIYTMGNDSRKFTISGNITTSLAENQPIERNLRAGIHAYGGTITMPQDTDPSPVSIQTLEFWVNPKGVVSGSGSGGGIIFDTRPYGGTAFLWLNESTGQWAWAGASAVYINGQIATSPVTANKFEDQHIVFVFASAFNTAINLATASQLADYALIANYPTVLTASQAAQLFANYSTVPTMPVTEVGTVTFAEPVNPYVFTVADWATLPQQ
jgi:hypothetical protein